MQLYLPAPLVITDLLSTLLAPLPNRPTELMECEPALDHWQSSTPVKKRPWHVTPSMEKEPSGMSFMISPVKRRNSKGKFSANVITS